MSKMEEIKVGDVIVHRKHKTAWRIMAFAHPNAMLQLVGGGKEVVRTLHSIFKNYRHEHGRERHERLNREAKTQ